VAPTVLPDPAGPSVIPPAGPACPPPAPQPSWPPPTIDPMSTTSIAAASAMQTTPAIADAATIAAARAPRFLMRPDLRVDDAERDRLRLTCCSVGAEA
jgi:hypothetical protein